MRHQNELPVRSTAGDHPMKRHHTARYYAHRVKENLTTRVSKLICAIFLTLLFLVGVITFVLWLSLRPHRPRFFVRELSIPGLGQENGFANAKIIFNVTARNSNQNFGFYYDAIQMTVNYQDQSIGGETLALPFYQEPKNTTILAGILGGNSLRVTAGQWRQFMADHSRGAVAFSIELSSTIRFKISTWESKHHRIRATCPVAVGADGSLLTTDRDKRCQVYFI
ncbi:NDR1/HIN1-like protein 26 [Olea europaea var. sylvestris]|uniref:NDR1/HIN1-like protein 26 n=1 Tax=Olea europaea var. sylvestris TaxID=158386 RepID=UPI000C1D4480|nr:NDR1/HIN1-like protein 26 [Olea europaea var. sylvestris]